jgi:phosphoglycolate phosphatase-like HAD superfamily hydrolase
MRNCPVTTAPIEFARSFKPRAIRHVLMDWDGTTSLSRGGWADIMAGLYAEHLPALPRESDAARREFARAELMTLNGKPSIHQMVHLAELVRGRGGEPQPAEEYHDEFQRRLGEAVRARLDRVKQEPPGTDSLLVRGVRALFETLRARDIMLTLVTGSVLHEVRHETELLDVARYFESVRGPHRLDDRGFSKRAVIEEVLRERRVEGAALLAFGDGPVEIRETKAVGGTAIAVASDEENHGSGRVDAKKRESLLAAGADAVIADFHATEQIVEAFISQ